MVMKKLCFILCLLLILLSFSSCSKVEEADAKEVVENLIEHIEQGDYDSASAIFCDAEVEGKTFPELLDEIEESTGLDFQQGIEIVECTYYNSKYSGMYGTIFKLL